MYVLFAICYGKFCLLVSSKNNQPFFNVYFLKHMKDARSIYVCLRYMSHFNLYSKYFLMF